MPPERALFAVVSGSTRVHSFVLKGQISSGTDGRTGQLTTAVEPFEMRMLPPNSYVRIENRFGFRRIEGFTQTTAVRELRPLSPDLPQPSVNVDPGEVSRQRVLAARWAIGILGSLDAILPLRAKRSENPATLIVTGPEGFNCYLDLSATGEPSRIRFSAVAPFYTPPAQGERQAGRKMEDAEWSWTFANRKAIDGVKVPHTLTVSARSLSSNHVTRIEEIELQTAQINPPLTNADFRPK